MNTASVYHRLCSPIALLAAWKQARRGKRYTRAAATFERALDSELAALADALSSETYQPGGYRHFTIHEPKRRKISAAPFRDRVVHHALCNVLIPFYERRFIADSYANRVGKGTHTALDGCTQFMRRFRYVLPCDIVQFFPAVDHAILKMTLARTITDPKILRLCGLIIDSGAGVLADQYDVRYFPGDDLFAADRPRGLPIGNLTSQFWANVYLDPLDQFVKHTLRCKGYLRYVDDFLLFADDKATLHRWKREIIAFLQTLRLTIHEERAHPVPVTQGIPFLGFTVYPDHQRLKRVKGIAYRRHLVTLVRRWRRGKEPRKAVDASIQAWLGHSKHGDTWKLRSRLFTDALTLHIRGRRNGKK